MQSSDFPRASGGVVFWDTGPSSRWSIVDRLTELGLEEYAPKERSDASALRGSIANYAALTKRPAKRGSPKRDRVVQPLQNQDENGFELVEIERGEDRNFYTSEFSAKVKDGQVIVSNGFAELLPLQSQFDALKRSVDGAAVGQCLGSVIEKLGGVLLRPNGGLWFIPERGLPTWERVAQAVEASGEKNRVYVMRTIMDAQTVRAVRDAIVSEVTEIASELAREVGSGDLGEQALENRIVKGKTLHARVSEYESLLGEALTHLHQIIQVSETAAASALAMKNTAEVYEDLYA